MNISYQGYHLADCSVSSIHGKRLIGGYRLLFSLSVLMNGLRDLKVSVSEIRGEVRIFADNKYHLLGTLWPEKPVCLQSKDHSHTELFLVVVDLNDQCLEEIEKMRGGGDLTFRVCVMGTADGQQGSSTTVEVWQDYAANQSAWHKVLTEMEYQRSLLFEVAIPKNEESSDFGQCVKFLWQAHEDYMGGRYGDAIGDCRKVLEQLAARLQDKSATETATEKYRNCQTKKSEQAAGSSTPTHKKNERESMSWEERFLLLRATLQHVTHLVHHPSDQQTVYSRSDAKCVLTVTTAIVDRFKASL